MQNIPLNIDTLLLSNKLLWLYYQQWMDNVHMFTHIGRGWFIADGAIAWLYNPNMDKWSHAQWSVGWNYLSIP